MHPLPEAPSSGLKTSSDAKERFFEIAGFPSGKQVFLKKRSFASEDGRDRVLRPPLDVLRPLEGARGSGSTDLASAQKKTCNFKGFVQKVF